jgi:hypothetical protein
MVNNTFMPNSFFVPTKNSRSPLHEGDVVNYDHQGKAARAYILRLDEAQYLVGINILTNDGTISAKGVPIYLTSEEFYGLTARYLEWKLEAIYRPRA